jgi:hypothetical protein
MFIHNMKYACILCIAGVIGCKEVFEQPLGNKHIILSAPQDNVISDSSLQTFFWQPISTDIPSDTSVTYEVQVVTPRFDSIVRLVEDTLLRANILTVSLPPAQYQWKVRAFNTSSTTPYSSPWTITIK